MPVTLDEVRRIASLARLRPVFSEEEALAARMTEIVRFAGGMEAPVEEEISPGGPETGSVREAEDEPEPGSERCLDRELVLGNAPDHRDGFVRLPPAHASREGGGSGQEAADGPAGEERP